MIDHDTQKDWRIGLTVRVKYRSHPRYYERGTVLEVLPNGTGGVFDDHGVLKVKLDGGETILDLLQLLLHRLVKCTHIGGTAFWSVTEAGKVWAKETPA